MACLVVVFVPNNNDLSSHMANISEHIISDQTRKIKKCENNNNSTCQLRCLHNILLMNIVNTPEKDLSEKSTYIFRKIIINIFPSSIREIYKKVNSSQKECLVLSSYLPRINTSILPRIFYDNIFYLKLVHELNPWI